MGRIGRIYGTQPVAHDDWLRQYPDVAQRHRQRRCGGEYLAASQSKALGTCGVSSHAALTTTCRTADDSLDIAPPALIKGYLRLGAKVLGAPTWDPDFNTADLPMMMRISDMPDRYRKHFLGA